MARAVLFAVCLAAAAIIGVGANDMSAREMKHDSMNSMDTKSNYMSPHSMGIDAFPKGSETIDISIDVNIISASMGGPSGKTEYSAPAMAAGTTHRVSSSYRKLARPGD